MKKIISFVLLTFGLLSMSSLVLAQGGIGDNLDKGLPFRPLTIQDIFDFINTVVNWFFAFVLAVAVIMILVAAFYYLTARGDSKKVQTASNLLMYALIGVGVAILAQSLVYLICTIVLPQGDCGSILHLGR